MTLGEEFCAASGLAVQAEHLFWAEFALVRREWQSEELIAYWTLVDRDWELVANKSSATRLGFALLLKFFELEGRFPAHMAE